jgi:phosphoribosyl 1,2-cyclic phosphate phosphodiesterase
VRVTFLGTGTSTGVPVLTCDCSVCTSSDPRDKRLRPSILLEWENASVLVDTGTDLREQGLRHDLRRVDAVLYTHAHADHILGLDELRLFNWRQRGPVPVYGSAATLAMIRKTFWYVFEEVQIGGGKPAITPIEIAAPFDLLGRRIVPVPIFHGTLPILGYRIGTFAYLTDASRIPDESYPLLEGLDVLVLNALRRSPHPTHFHLEQAIDEAKRIGAKRTLFTHMAHETSHADLTRLLPGGVEIAYDGLVLDVGTFP